jgi:c-di-GMP-binding flagellar brake protein YcgR
MLWTKDQEHTLNSHVGLFSEAMNTLYVAIPKGFDARAFLDELKAKGLKEVFFSVSLTRANIFFKTELNGADRAGLVFAKPERVYKVQRRRDLRFRIPDGMVLPMEHADPLSPASALKRKVIDLSAGGMGFLVSYDDEAVYAVGLVLKDLHFTIGGRPFTLDAEIRHVQPLPPEGRFPGVKVGVSFRNIRESDSQWIASFVFEQSRRYFTRIG